MSADPSVLDVWLDGRVVADLVMTRRRVPQLRYRPEYVAKRASVRWACRFRCPSPAGRSGATWSTTG
jgi:hypothetical protein